MSIRPRPRARYASFAVTGAAALVVLLAVAAPAAAGVLVVGSTADFGGSCALTGCTLRQAVIAANQRPGADVVLLAPGTYTLTRAGRGEDAAQTGDLDVLGELTVIGAGADKTVIDAGGLDRAFDLRGAARLALYGVSVKNGDPGDAAGGAIRATDSGSALEIVRSTLADSQVGGLADGGAIFALGALTVTDSALTGNQAGDSAGGIYAGGAAVVTNSTLSANVAHHSFGGGIYVVNGGSLELRSSTLCDNMAMRTGGALQVTAGRPATVTATIMARNASWGGAPDCWGTLTSGGYNLIGVGHACYGATDGVAGDRVGTLDEPLDPMLAPLAMNGGHTPTLEPLAGSPAIDAGPPSGTAGCAATDQRGGPRGIDGDSDGLASCDVGAVEVSVKCMSTANALCLVGGRFRVAADWSVGGDAPESAMAVQLTDDTGYFWFFRDSNVEIVAKVLDACVGFDRFWVFASGLTNVGVALRVEDLVTGESRVYTHDAGPAFQPIQDTEAFATCGY